MQEGAVDKEESTHSFQQMNLQRNLQMALTDFGYLAPTESQQQLIQSIQQRKDVLLIASAGTGKTIGAIIALMQIIDPNIQKCQAIFLCPCREVTRRTLKPIIELSQHSQFGVRIFTGGSSPRQDRQALRKENIQIALGTPGRMLDMLKRRFMEGDEVKIVVIDEADELLSRGFYNQLQEIFYQIPSDVIVCIASATRGGIQLLQAKALQDPVQIIESRE